MGDKSPKSVHKQAVQKQSKTDADRQKRVAIETAKQVEKPKK